VGISARLRSGRINGMIPSATVGWEGRTPLLVFEWRQDMKQDLRPSLPVATKTGHVWLIDGIAHNFSMPANKYGELSNAAKPASKEIFAKYAAGSSYLVGVFLPCAHTK